MKRVPDVLLNTTSSAERRVFELISEVSLGPNWTAFHSLNCSEHPRKQWSEIDFLLVGPEGIFVLEVKGGGVGVQDGIWQFTDRYQKVHEKREGPFEQAKTARFALEKLLDERFDLRSYPIRPRFGFGVIFPDTRWDIESPEMPRAIVADAGQCSSPSSLTTALRRMIDYWVPKVRQSAAIAPVDLKRLQHTIRPNVDVYPPFTAQLGHTARELQSLTEEQYIQLDAIEGNPRVVVTGGAGTGKTFLMMQSARREAAQARSVLVVTESEVLAGHIRMLEPDQGIRITSFAGLQVLSQKVHDVLFVDEGQDLLDLEILEELGNCVTGGLEDGRWRWFMDDNNQSHLSGRFDSTARSLLLAGLGPDSPAKLKLKRNVRNTKPIVEAVEHWTGSTVGIPMAKGTGKPPIVHLVHSFDEVLEVIEGRLESLRDLEVPLEQVGIVAHKDMKPRILDELSTRWRRKALPLDPTTVRANLSGKLLVGTAADFKGLERPVQIVAGLDPGPGEIELAAFYVATTRGNFDLTVIRIEPR